MNPRSWFPHSRVARWVGAWFGWLRLTRAERGPDGHLLFVEPRWYYVGRKAIKAIRRFRNEDGVTGG